MSKKLLAAGMLPWAAFAHAPLSFAQDTAATETIVVTANRLAQSTQSLAAQVEVVTRDDIDRIQAKTLIDVFRRMTGIQVSQNGGRGQQASLFVRGANSDQVLVLVDGIRFARAAKGNVDFSQLPLTFVERIEYVRGARASLYGSEAIGGVINIITRANNNSDQSTRLTVGLGSLDYREASVSSGLEIADNGQLNFALGFDGDDGYNVRPNEFNAGDKHGYESKNGLVGYSHQFSKQWEAFGSVRAYDNVSQYDGSFSSRSYNESTVENLSLAGGVNYTADPLSSQFQFSWQDQSDWNYEQAKGKGSVQSEDLQQLNFQWNTQYTLNDVVTLAGGVDWRDEALIVNASNSKHDRTNLAFYGVGLFEADKVFGEVSARLDDNEQFGREGTYNLGAGYHLTDKLTAKLSYGTAFKAPNLFQLYSSYGNKNLKPESAESLELTLSGQIKDLYWSITGYNTKIDDLIDYDFATNSYLNIDGESTLRGVEITSEFDTGFVSHQISADFKDPEDKDGNTLVRRAKQQYKYNGIVSFEQFDVSLGYQYVGKRKDFSKELSAYSLFDFSVNYFANEHLTLNARIDNLTDEEYETAAGYPSPERAYYLSADYRF
ncbi:Vitamin B12 transporter BtuB precursor [Grimontia celer]|uniref:Vitamin B12 transporter BtuB n=1 Tax=Grimontia celer TaxID=1796497 RepID=A0A128FDX2_9GAMM|nr:TonB-dependent vitamin B12 receptor [Grimontia celer]CZF84997.1 Vitamin B12 transporter BtuB precursor [Grimontia celer]